MLNADNCKPAAPVSTHWNGTFDPDVPARSDDVHHPFHLYRTCTLNLLGLIRFLENFSREKICCCGVV